MPLCKLRQWRISSALDDARELPAALRDHLDACPRCREFHQRSLAIAASLAPVAADSPPWLHTKIMARLHAVGGSARPASSLPRWLPAAGAAALAVVAATIALQPAEPEAVEPTQPQVTLRAPVAPHPASVTDRLEQHAKQALTQEFHHLATDIAGARNFLSASLRNTIPGLSGE